MNVTALIRIAAFVVLGCLFVSDYMFNLWVKDVPREAYLVVIAVALGVDIEFLRGILINAISKSLGTTKEDD